MEIEMITSKTITLPKWINNEIDEEILLVSNEDKMKFVLDLATKNVKKKSGGPFAAAVFNGKTNELVSVGLNCVVDNNSSIAHAEVVALTLAQEKLKTFRLADELILVSSAQPCVMCTGAVLWSGVKTLIYGATKEDVEEIVGFDEGPLHPNWVEEFEQRGIKVIGKILNQEAREALQLYKDNEGILY